METHFPYHVADTFECVSEGPIAKARELYNLYHLVNQTWLTQGERRRLQPEMLARLRQRQRLAWERMAPMVDDFFRELREHYEAEVVFCADHGDNFGEQGWQYHFSNVNDAGTRVPLLWLRHDRDEARIEPRPVSTRDVFGTLLRIAGHPDPALANLLERPEHSLPVMQAYWYDRRGRTLPCFRYNQFAFVSGQRRYAHRIDRWYEAPITRADEPESPFRALEPGVDALEVALLSRKQAAQLRRIFRAYRQFSAQIMAAR
jgi:arylsulfatase A-like enzyme